jgi:alkylation response protein AidB-like acyl-CoA dehydrogenase
MWICSGYAIAVSLRLTRKAPPAISREREQFGRPIGRFQAVQAHLVTIDQQATVVASAIDGAVAAVELGRGGFEIACAKCLPTGPQSC